MWLVGDVAFSSITHERTEQTEYAAVEFCTCMFPVFLKDPFQQII